MKFESDKRYSLDEDGDIFDHMRGGYVDLDQATAELNRVATLEARLGAAKHDLAESDAHLEWAAFDAVAFESLLFAENILVLDAGDESAANAPYELIADEHRAALRKARE